MFSSDTRKLILRIFVLAVLISFLAVFSTGAGRRFLGASFVPSTDTQKASFAAARQAPVSGGKGPANSHVNPQEPGVPPATPIQVGVMSERQRKHSKLYGRYKTDKKLDEIPPSEFKQGVEPGVYIGPGIPVVGVGSQPASFEEFLRNKNCEADVVVKAVIKDLSSQLTENREFIFTDYTAEVTEIYKNNLTAPISQNDSIIFTRPGGRVEINGRVVMAIDASFKLLKPGRQYILFLKYLPETNTYQAIRQGSFEVNDQTLIPMTEEFLPGVEGDGTTFSGAVRDALYVNCRNQ